MTTPMEEIERHIKEQIERQQRVLVRRMCLCAEKITNYARSNYTYLDRTGNLTSSLGCVVVLDGNVVYSSSFEPVKEGAVGAAQGKHYALELASKFPQGIVLIAVAGKEYAVHVQNRGYNVLQGAEIYAEQLVPQMLRQLGFKV